METFKLHQCPVIDKGSAQEIDNQTDGRSPSTLERLKHPDLNTRTDGRSPSTLERLKHPSSPIERPTTRPTNALSIAIKTRRSELNDLQALRSKSLCRMSDIPRGRVRVRAKSVASRSSSQSYNPQEEDGSQETPSTQPCTQPPSASEQAPTDQEELLRAQRVAQSSASSTYTSYREPELSDQRDKHGRRMIAYPCKL
ncbi:hypothetical protein PGT21_014144 [Puccinia graminis f. sp. tritici]|uniref:Uncharacterized protein n=1 Tax=Puccinia graminis f. sp. tritici TaxID=56615 RepID=A0A5B0N2F2_PUCGR|nr:hypothetical protein PGT21_014144 [Puccinia graminis f. sp. tritici]